MPIHTSIITVALLPLVLAATPALGQVYKWVDERGVVNYSNQKPMNPGTVGKLSVVEEKVSFYTPDNALMRVIEAERSTGGLSSRVADLERQLDAERRARQNAAVAVAPPQRELCTLPSANCAGLVDYYNSFDYGYPVYPYTVVTRGRPGGPWGWNMRPPKPVHPIHHAGARPVRGAGLPEMR